jgi:hypothetical protein
LYADKRAAFVFADFVYGNDVGVVEGRNGPGFLDEARPPVAAAQPVFAQEFDRDEPFQAVVACLVDHAHPAFADSFEQLEVPEGSGVHRLYDSRQILRLDIRPLPL